MGKIFDIDGGVFGFLTKASNLVILNLIFIVCCIPIITIGPATTAMYYVSLKIAKNEESYIIRSFFKSFKENLKQGILIWLFFLLAIVVFYVDFRIISQSGFDPTLRKVFNMLFTGLSVLAFMVFTYIFPVLSKFENSIKNTFKNALLMSIRHLPWTVLMILASTIPVLSFLFIFRYAIPFTLLIGFALPAFINAYMFNRIFKHYIPDDEEEDEYDELDETETKFPIE